MSTRYWAAVLWIAAFASGVPMNADASQESPGSCLLFPYYDTTGSTISFHSIQNVGSQTVAVRLVFVNGVTCEPKDAYIDLTPMDTFTFCAHGVLHGWETGFLYAYVVQKKGHAHSEVDYDFLVGQEFVLGKWGHEDVYFSLNAVSFQGLKVVQDGKIHLDGNEYTLAPKSLHFPRFFGQEALINSRLILINLTGGKYFQAAVRYYIYNDNEIVFTSTGLIDCFEVIPLTSVSPAFQKSFLLSTNHALLEPWPYYNFLETGAIKIFAEYAYNAGGLTIPDASMYAVLLENFGNLGYGISDLPFQIDDGKTHYHGMLWSTDPSGT